ncbi:hypothetical protein IWW50_004891 [Coemansia erecta]|nr:hypothetical protein IWW50_004891 [Coemansia erecta]
MDSRRQATETTPLVDDADAAKQRRDELKGYVFMATSALGFATSSACVKALALSGMPPLEIVFARSVVQLLLGLLGCAWYGVRVAGPPHVRPWLVLRGAAGALGNACFFYAVSVMTLADATVVFFTGPVFSAVFAHVMLGEPYDGVDRLASLLCMGGIVLVVRPAFLFGARDEGSVAGAFAALFGAMSGALAYCVVRRVGRAVHAMVHVVYFGFTSFVGSLVALSVGADFVVPQTRREYALMVGLGVCAFGGQVLLNRGLQLAPAGPGTLMRNLDVVFAFVFGVMVFGEVPDWIGVLGALVIVSCTVGMGWHKIRSSS